MPRLPDLFPEAGPARRGMRGWRIPLGRGRVCARASVLQKCRCPAQFSCLAPLSPLPAEAATRFSPGPALSRRREACSSVLRRLCPREVSRPKWPFFCGAAPAFRRLRRAEDFPSRHGARATGKLHARGGLAMALRRAQPVRFSQPRTSAQAGRAPVAEGQVGSDLRHRSCGVAS